MKELSSGEVQIIAYAADGFTAKEIARLIGLDRRTIESYVGNIRKKLAARNITHAVAIAGRCQVLAK